MANAPGMYSLIQNLIDQGNGFAAQVLGPPFDVYRVSNQSSCDMISQSNQIATQVNIIKKIGYGAPFREALEAEKEQSILWYKLVGDMRNFLVGDVFVLNDPNYGQGFTSVSWDQNEMFEGFFLAYHPALRKTVGARLNTSCTITRASSTPDAQGRWLSTKGKPGAGNGGCPVICQNGRFQVGDPGQIPSRIPCGLMSSGRTFGRSEFDAVPGDRPKSSFGCLVPPLRGLKIREGDWLTMADGTVYTVLNAFDQAAGAVADQLFLEREINIA